MTENKKEVEKEIKIKELADMDCEELKPYCPWENESVFCTGGAVSMCEGRFCEEAYENYVDEMKDEINYYKERKDNE